MLLPNEIIQVIVGYLNNCPPDYMHVRQINRGFRYVCQSERFENKFATIVNDQFSKSYSFNQFVSKEPGLLWLRFIKKYYGPFRDKEKIAEGTYIWTKQKHLFKWPGNCYWGIKVNTNYFYGYRRPLQGELIIVKALDKDLYKQLFSMDISVPEDKLCTATWRSWIEHDEGAPVPLKYITIHSWDLYQDPFTPPDEFLVRMVDVWNHRRFDIHVTWDEDTKNREGGLRFIATTFSKFGVLIITCWKNPTKVLIVGRERYLQSSDCVDISQLFDYFNYIISKNLTVLVDTGYDYNTTKSMFAHEGPEFYPLTKENWFGSHHILFRLPPRAQIPTYEQFLEQDRKSNVQPESHISLKMEVHKRHGPEITPDLKICPQHFWMEAPFYDNNFVFCTNRHGGEDHAVIDVRAASIDVIAKKSKFRLLKIPLPRLAHDHLFVSQPDLSVCCYKLDAASLLYNASEGASLPTTDAYRDEDAKADVQTKTRYSVAHF